MFHDESVIMSHYSNESCSEVALAPDVWEESFAYEYWRVPIIKSSTQNLIHEID